jgi:hypothetical protein
VESRVAWKGRAQTRIAFNCIGRKPRRFPLTALQ